MKLNEIHLHSGGALGADTVWSEMLIKAGVPNANHHHYFIDGFRTPNGNESIPKDQGSKANTFLTKANNSINRKFPTSDDYVNSLLQRNHWQVKNSSAIFAIGYLDPNGQVKGGTAWATQMGIDAGKPVYLFDQNSNQWLKWETKISHPDRNILTGRMDYAFENFKSVGIKSPTTLEAIALGERTATTRYSFHNTIDYWKKAQAGDAIIWKNDQHQLITIVTNPITQLEIKNLTEVEETHKINPETIKEKYQQYVSARKIGANNDSIHDLKEDLLRWTNAEEWSLKEGWSKEYFFQEVLPNLSSANQIQYKLATNTELLNLGYKVSGKFILCPEPKLTQDFAGVGSRDLKENGYNAIINIVQNSLQVDLVKELKTAKNISTPESPLEIFVDGSDIKGTGAIGYGVYTKHNGKEYSISGAFNNHNLATLEKDLGIQITEPISNFTMELYASLQAIRNTPPSEYLHIKQDLESVQLMIHGTLMARLNDQDFPASSSGKKNFTNMWKQMSEEEKKTTFKKSQEIIFLDPQLLEKSRTINWEDREPPHYSKITRGQLPQETYTKRIIDEIVQLAIDRPNKIQYTWIKGHTKIEGNEKADRLAKSRDEYNTFGSLFQPKSQNMNAANSETSKPTKPRYFEDTIPTDAKTIYVFESNTQGRHGLGTALHAKNNYAAIYGISEGFQGKSYAIPTKCIDKTQENHGDKSIPKAAIKTSIEGMYSYAKMHPEFDFHVAFTETTQKMLNGYTGIEMMNLFKSAAEETGMPVNMIFSKSWFDAGILSDKSYKEVQEQWKEERGFLPKEENFKIAVSGSAKLDDYEKFETLFTQALEQWKKDFQISDNKKISIITTSNQGVDQLAEQFAGKHKMESFRIPLTFTENTPEEAKKRDAHVVSTTNALFVIDQKNMGYSKNLIEQFEHYKKPASVNLLSSLMKVRTMVVVNKNFDNAKLLSQILAKEKDTMSSISYSNSNIKEIVMAFSLKYKIPIINKFPEKKPELEKHVDFSTSTGDMVSNERDYNSEGKKNAEFLKFKNNIAYMVACNDRVIVVTESKKDVTVNLVTATAKEKAKLVSMWDLSNDNKKQLSR